MNVSRHKFLYKKSDNRVTLSILNNDNTPRVLKAHLTRFLFTLIASNPTDFIKHIGFHLHVRNHCEAPSCGDGTLLFSDIYIAKMAVFLSTLCNEVYKRVLKAGDTMSGNLTMNAQIQAKPDSASVPSYSWSNDSNTGFYSVSTHHIGVASAGSLICTLTSGRQIFENNRVLSWKRSDGTTTDILYVDTINRVRLFSPNGDIFINENANNTCHINHNNLGKVMIYNGTTAIMASSGNNIGIGTTTPSSALHVIGVINASSKLQQGGTDISTLFAPSNHTHSADAISSGTLSRDRLPSATTSLAGTVVLSDSTSDSSTSKAATANAVRSAYNHADAALPKSGGTMTGSLFTNNVIIPNNTFLRWKNTSGVDKNILFVDNANAVKLFSAGGGMDINADENGSLHLNYNNTGGIKTHHGTTPVITQSGTWIGINTTTPLAPLHVVGNAGGATQADKTASYFSGGGTTLYLASGYGTNWSIRASDHIGAVGFVSISDERIKTQVKDIEADFETMMKLRPVSYTFKDQVQRGNRQRYGFIAQEVQKLLPDMVYQSEDIIPDIYRLGTYDASSSSISWSVDESGLLYEGAEIKVGDIIKVIAKRDSDNDAFVTVNNVLIAETTIKVSIESNPAANLTNELFIHGRKVSDFKNINYDDVMSWSVAQLQHVYQMHLTDRETIAKLEDRVQKLEQLLIKI